MQRPSRSSGATSRVRTRSRSGSAASSFLPLLRPTAGLVQQSNGLPPPAAVRDVFIQHLSPLGKPRLCITVEQARALSRVVPRVSGSYRSDDYNELIPQSMVVQAMLEPWRAKDFSHAPTLCYFGCFGEQPRSTDRAVQFVLNNRMPNPAYDTRDFWGHLYIVNGPTGESCAASPPPQQQRGLTAGSSAGPRCQALHMWPSAGSGPLGERSNVALVHSCDDIVLDVSRNKKRRFM